MYWVNIIINEYEKFGLFIHCYLKFVCHKFDHVFEMTMTMKMIFISNNNYIQKNIIQQFRKYGKARIHRLI